MRHPLRLLLLTLLTLLLFAVLSLTSTRSRVRAHLADTTQYRLHFQWPSRTPTLFQNALKPPPSTTPIQPLPDDGKPRPPNNYTLHPTAPPRALVMAALSAEETTWTSELPAWSPYIYTVDAPSVPLHTPRNKGREAMAYLTYIIEQYHNLADTVAFIHSHKDGWPRAWHTDDEAYSNVNSLNELRTSHVQTVGYVNMRCVTDVGCPAEILPYRWNSTNNTPDGKSKQAKKGEKGEKGKTKKKQVDHKKEAVERAFLEAWPIFFPELDEVPEVIASACCAQFAVSSEQIRKRPLKDYKRIRKWLLETELSDDAAGRVMEYSWHVMFGREAVFCPEMAECWCSVYGACFEGMELG